MMEDTAPALVCNANANLALRAAYHPKALQGPEFGIANPPAELGRILGRRPKKLRRPFTMLSHLVQIAGITSTEVEVYRLL